MTIESASFPADLSQWDGNDDPYYFEVFGETCPVVDASYAEVASARSGQDSEAPSTEASPIYEYWWTIGHPGHRPDDGGFLEKIVGPKNMWERLPDPAARVYLFFPMGGGWRVKELAATVKYMTPIAHEESFWEKTAKDWQTIQPLVDGASKLAGVAGPLAGGAAAQSAKALGALAKLKMSSVPQVKGFEWSAGKVAFGNKKHGGVAQGVMWTLPASMFKELGGRLTGSLAVSFIPDHHQDSGVVANQVQTPEAQDLLAHAVIYSPDGHADDMWVPSNRDFVKLRIQPRLSPTS